MERKLLKIDELCAALSVDKKTVFKLIKANAIPFLKLGERTFRFDLDEVVNALKTTQRANAA